MLFAIALSGFAQSTDKATADLKNDWTIVPGVRFGPITPATDIAELPDLFGKDNVQLSKRPGPEGQGEVEIVLVYPGTDDQVEIQFNADAGGKIVSALVEGGQWKISNGLGIGSTLAEIEKLNEKPITFLGLGWDYGGYITSYNEGKLEPLFDGDRPLGLQLSFDGQSTPKDIVGDVELRSDDDDIPKDKLKIASIYQQFQIEEE